MKVGVVPAVVLAVVIGLVAVFNLFAEYTFNPPYLQLILNLIFITGTGIVVAIISAKTYLSHGSPNILLLGSAVLVSGLTALFAGWASSSANANISIFNIGILASSVLQCLSAVVTFEEIKFKALHSREVTLAVAYTASIIFVLLLTVVTVLGGIPTFFTPSGPTWLREATLGAATFFFTLACFIYSWQYIRSKSKILYWYSLALVLIAVGLTGSLFEKQFSGVLSWLNRLIQYVGGFYFILTLLTL